MRSYWNGDSWRWATRYHATPSTPSIQVIEPPDPSTQAQAEHEEQVERMPFGFARALLQPEADEPVGQLPVTDPRSGPE